MIDDTTPGERPTEDHPAAPGRPRPIAPPPRRQTGRTALVLVALAAAVGIGAGATAIANKGGVTLVALPPEPVTALKDGTMAAIKGNVVEIFGNKFIMGDASGRALVETGRRGEGGTLVAKGETVTVQGRFEHGFLHAVAITHGDGHSVTLDPPPPPPPPGRPGPNGPGADGPLAAGPAPANPSAAGPAAGSSGPGLPGPSTNAPTPNGPARGGAPPT